MSTGLEEAYKKEIGIADSHKLVLVDKKVRQSGGRDDEDFYFDEINERGEVVAKYHAWSHQETYPPLNAKNGYEKIG